ncbi:MAG TPA: amidoligase family protein [Thermohalobaculum sp.]|nr:amidoligase family protein [Thermohalobaculum sp.]
MADAAGEQGRVGVEIEFAGLDAHAAARVLADALGGEAVVGGPHDARVTGSRLGELELELDTRYARPPDEQSGLVDRALESLGAREEAVKLLSIVVPVELVTPPLAPAQFPALEEAVAALRAAGAEGTEVAPHYAFGMHLNISLDHGGAERAIRIAAAYGFAERWLRDRFPVDPSRRVVPFIDPYPKGWKVELAEAMAGGAVPGIEAFVRLYQNYNPNRNRGLDLWPILGHLAPEAVARIHRQPVRNPRPAFHCRWPDSRVGDPGWSPWQELERWRRVERAADDPDRLERARAQSLGVESGRGPLSAYLAALDEVMA